VEEHRLVATQLGEQFVREAVREVVEIGEIEVVEGNDGEPR
jgi:hypothetical protein